MDRRVLLACGSGVLSVGLAGCLDSVGVGEDNTTEHSATESTSSATATRTTQPGTEQLLLQNSDSEAREVSVTVIRQSGEEETLIDASYEVPSEYILEFTDLLEHGQEYRFDLTTGEGKSVTKTLAAESCSDDQYNSSGDRSVLIWIAGHPGVRYKECDVLLPPKYTRSSVDQHEISDSEAEATTTTTT